MGNTTAAPDPQADVDALDTPADEAEPVEQIADEPEADQPAGGGPIGQAEYTRATQVAAAIRRELGLSKNATQAEILEALAEARYVPEDDGEDEVAEAPELVAERERRIAAELRVTTAVYGEKFTSDGLALLNDIRSTDDLDELFTKLHAFVLDYGTAPAPAAGEAPADDGGEEQIANAEGIDLSEGDAAPRQQSTSRRRGDTAVVTAVRDIIGKALNPT